jgi:hypothetical protein
MPSRSGRAKDLDLVVRWLLSVCSGDRLATDEGTHRDSLEIDLAVVGERGHHRPEIAAWTPSLKRIT